MARISEMHYSNAFASSTGVAEFLEIALAPGEDPADFSAVFYQANGTQGLVVPLTDPGVRVTFDTDANEFVYVISADTFNIALTDPDGGGAGNYEAYALVNTAEGTVGDFYDIGGGTQNITAVDGLAAGATSTNVPVPTDPNSSTYSIQFNQPAPDTVVYEPISEGGSGVICFTPGTMILTPAGECAVEALSAGDLVITRDGGAQPVLWVSRQTVAPVGTDAPVTLPAHGWAGNVTGPVAMRPLTVSRCHRVLLSSPQLDLTLGFSEGLAMAGLLPDARATLPPAGGPVTYIHILLAEHHLVCANGHWAETFLPGPVGFATLTPRARGDLAGLSADPLALMAMPAARPLLRAWEISALGASGALANPRARGSHPGDRKRGDVTWI